MWFPIPAKIISILKQNTGYPNQTTSAKLWATQMTNIGFWLLSCTASPRSSKLTHWGWDILQTTFSNAFSLMKMFQFRLRFHWSLLFSLNNKQQWNLNRGLINNIPALVQIMAWRRPGDKPLSEPMVVSLLTHICVTRPQWVKVTWQIGILVNNAINW